MNGTRAKNLIRINTRKAITVAALLLITGTTGIGRAAEPDAPDSAEIRRLAQEDQADRSRTFAEFQAGAKRFAARDRERRRRMAQLLQEDRVVTAEDFDHAALLYQHGERPSDYLSARELAIVAGMKGKYSSLPALAEDRFLVSIHRPQRFGSQSHFDKDGKQSLQPVDEGSLFPVTDGLRLDMFIPPLALSRSKFEKATEEAFPIIAERAQQRLDPSKRRELEDSETSRRLLALYDYRDVQSPLAPVVLALLIYREDRLAAPRDYFHVAFLLERDAGSGKSDAPRLLLANELATVAALRGHSDAPKLFAKTWDRYARATKLKTRYGTLPKSRIDEDVSPGVRRLFWGSRLQAVDPVQEHRQPSPRPPQLPDGDER
jgi:hypothetical protein